MGLKYNGYNGRFKRIFFTKINDSFQVLIFHNFAILLIFISSVLFLETKYLNNLENTL